MMGIKESAEDQYSDEDTQRRLEAALRGAFNGPPTSLKDIPKKSGESRSLKRAKPQRFLRRQRKNRAA
jgi:hypothetical protein